ncbi:MAG: class I SAM-dependent methyltransferase [Candidatus Bipolaricaulaceae bacterium]
MAKTSYRIAPGVQVYRALIDPLVAGLRPRIVGLCRALGARNVVDIACATGAQSRALGRAGLRATGVDLSADMVRGATRLGGPNVRYVHASALNLPFPTASFDAALLVLALHEHCEAERTAMLAEAFRVTRPGGYLVVGDFAAPSRPRLHLPWQGVRLVERLAGGEHHAGFRDFVARGSLGGLLDRHGLTPVRWDTSHRGTIAIAAVPAGSREIGGAELEPDESEEMAAPGEAGPAPGQPGARRGA